ncbi:hypothetical protein AB1E19_011359 [Capra hircus]
MYLLLGQLSLMDLLFTSVVTPKAIMDFLLSENTISFVGCALQMFLALTLGGSEDLLLAFMAYDRNYPRTVLMFFLHLLHFQRRPPEELKEHNKPDTFLVLYTLALTSNGLLLLVITMDARLHVPMYLLLRQLSLMDLLFTSVVTPKAIMDFLLSENTISFGGCALQVFLVLTLGGAEDLLLAFMAYDRQLKKQHRMEHWNSTLGSGFILLGILNNSGFPGLLCVTISVLYMLTLTSNGLLLLVITMDAWLHVPMYLLLRQLSLMDLLFTSVVTPKAIVDFLLSENTISFGGCAFQMFLALTVGGAEDLLLAFMAYDRYVAICHPLNYMVLMRPRVCWLMMATPWVLASLNALCHTLYTMHFPFCMSRKINHLLCEIPPLLKLACEDASRYELMLYVTGVTFLIPPLVAILASYTLILLTVLHMPSNEGRQKALVTCSSHLTVVGMFYGAATFMYVLPSSLHSPKQDNIISVFYTIVTPALNPLIYSLRNKEVMGALRRVLQKYML